MERRKKRKSFQSIVKTDANAAVGRAAPIAGAVVGVPLGPIGSVAGAGMFTAATMSFLRADAKQKKKQRKMRMGD